MITMVRKLVCLLDKKINKSANLPVEVSVRLHPISFRLFLHSSLFGKRQLHGLLLSPCGEGDADDAVKQKMQRPIVMIETFIILFLYLK